jgi:pimeloyl-ACP methyl ester carboxylesterase
MLQAVVQARAGVTDETVPPGRLIELPGRGTTFAVDIPGPPGAPTLFLLHGLVASTYLNWFPSFAALSAQYRVIAMDLRGHGRGIPLNGRRFRLADCADDAALVATRLGVDRFIPVGYSLGGPVAQLLWRRHPDRVAGLVLAATSRNFMGTRQERLFFQSLVGLSSAARLTGWLPWVHEGPAATLPQAEGRMSSFALAELRRTSPNAVLQAMSAMGRFSSREWIGDIDVPTAVVITSNDHAIGAERQMKLARAIPGATTHLAAAGHTACVLGADAFVPALVEACRSVTDRLGVSFSSSGADPSPVARCS